MGGACFLLQKKHANSQTDQEDIISIGTIGLIKGINKNVDYMYIICYNMHIIYMEVAIWLR